MPNPNPVSLTPGSSWTQMELIPDSEPLREDGQRVGGSTIPDNAFMPIVEDGRQYQGYMPGGYSLPIDDEEQDRLDMTHHGYKILLDGKLSIVPFEEAPRHVLDIGTGTGIWALEFAEQSPDSFVIGTDISSIQPPPRTNNCSFIIHDSEKADWRVLEPFDFIHMRSIGPCFQNFPMVLEKSFEHMQPGGWIELQDCVWKPECVDDTMQGTSIPDFFDRLCRGARTLGHDLLKASRFTALLEQAGFVDIQEVIVYNGGSPWPRDPKMKQIGYYLGTLLYAATESHGKLLRASGLSEEELESLKARFKADLNRIDIHWYLPV